ncbi:helicase RecD/TraA family [Clostridium sp. CAG:567]|nr:helicase RecD/TraA family [Clostridium sp. CAG:567]
MEIKGRIRDIIYRNEINSYTIATFETDEEETTVVGYLPFIEKGDSLKITGNFVEHPEYGRQLKIETFEKLMPEDLDSIENYLANGKFKGIGPATAKRMVNTFGKDVINIIKFEPEKLSCIKGITEEKAIEISQSFNENWEVWQIVSYLEKFGIGPQSAEEIYKKLGPNTITTIEENPYILIDLTVRVNFTQIDQIAIKMGMDLENDKRIRSGIKYALKLSTNNGHCAVLYENLIQFVKDLLNVSESMIENNIIFLKTKNEIVLEDRENQEWVYLYNYYMAEKNVAESLITLDNYLNVKKISNFEKKLKKIEKHSDLELSEKQREAVIAVQEHNVCVITGGPGTGKTTIIKTIIEMYKQEEKKVVLCAPTGRAAKRMSEATGEEAKTLHRLLEIGKTSSDELQNIDPNVEVAPLDADVIIVDEVSMVDIFLMNYLLQAIYKGTKLVLVGDSNQLPSVGPGNVLKDIIQSERLTTITLNKIFRQAAKSKIILNSHKVNEGISIFSKDEQNENEELIEDFFFINETNKLKVLENVISLCTGRLERYGNYTFAQNIQVISPTKKGELGTKELNKSLQQAINPESEEKNERKYIDSVFREGDRIMQIKNNYDIYWEKREPTLEMGKGVFNGEYGTILNIDEVEKKVKIKFDDDKLVWYNFDELEQIEHSYCITVHKAQRK